MNCVSIGSDNSLPPVRHQAIISTITGLLSIEPLGTIVNEIIFETQNFSFWKYRLRYGGHFDELTSLLFPRGVCQLPVFLRAARRWWAPVSRVWGRPAAIWTSKQHVWSLPVSYRATDTFHIASPLWGKPPMTGGFPSQKAVDAKLSCLLGCWSA